MCNAAPVLRLGGYCVDMDWIPVSGELRELVDVMFRDRS